MSVRVFADEQKLFLVRDMAKDIEKDDFENKQIIYKLFPSPFNVCVWNLLAIWWWLELTTMNVKIKQRGWERKKRERAVKFPPGVFPHFFFFFLCEECFSCWADRREDTSNRSFWRRARAKRDEEFIAQFRSFIVPIIKSIYLCQMR